MMKSLYTASSARLLYSLPLILLAGCGSPEERAQGFYEKGMELIAKNDDLAARVQLLSAAKYKADRVDVWRALVGVEERLKSGPSVFQDLRRVVELDPNDLDARVKLARIMAGGGAADAALKMIEVVNDSGRPNAPLHALKANILLRTNDPAGAVREAQRALEIDSKNIDATMLVAAKKVADGDADGALKLLNALPATDSQDQLRISLQKAQIFVRKGDVPQAEALLRKLITENPKESTLRAQLIQLYISAKRFDDAERELRATANAAPTDSKAGMDLVRFLVSVKGAKAGRDELNARIKAGADVFDYQLAMAELDFAEGDVAAAAESLQKLANAATTPDRKLLVQTKLAEIYVNKANIAAAEPIIADILQKDRRNTIGLRLRAAIKIEQGQVDSAIADLREALNDQPKSADLLMLMATAYERGGKNELAERQYADALKASGLNPNIASRYIAFLQRRGDFIHAEDVLSDVIARNPANTQLLATLGQIRLSRQNWTGALTTADAIARLGDKSGLADQIRASAFAGQNKTGESVAALEKAHAAAPDAVQPVVSLVSNYVRLGKTDKAESLLQEMFKKYPNNAEILVLMGQTKLAQNRNDDAKLNYKAAIAKQPKDPNGYSALSDLYVREKDYNSAVEVIQAGLHEQPGNLNLRFTSAGLQIIKGDQAGAITLYESILKDQPNSVLAINNLVSLLLDTRSDKESLDRAFSLAERLKGSTVPQFQDTYGWAQYKKGDAKSAVATLETAQEKLPNLAAVQYHLGMSYAATGQSDKAAEHFQKALALEPDGTSLKDSIRAATK
jgi:cellulose synthase operon protein C